MVSRKAVKITGAALAVTAIAIGLGIGLGRKKNETTKQLSASQASGWNAYCGRRLDGTGRLFKAPTNNVRGEERKLGKEFIDCSGSLKGSSITDLCAPAMIEVPCACPVVPTPPTPSFSKGSSGGGNNVAPNPSGKSKSGGGNNVAAKPSGAWRSDGHDRELQWGSDGHTGGNVVAASGGSKSGGESKSSGSSLTGGSKGGSKSKSSGSSFTVSKSSGSKSKSSGSSFTVSKSSGSKSKSSGSSFTVSKSSGSKGSFVSGGNCMCAVTVTSKGSFVSKGSKGSFITGGSKGSKGSFITGGSKGSKGSCTCLAPAMSGSKGSKGTTSSGLVPVSCPCSEPVAPVTPALCEPTPQPTPKPVNNIIPSMPTTPAPTPCVAQRFFLVNGVCTNDMFLLGGTSYSSAMECCNINFGSGSMLSGTCSYIDTCNTPAPTTIITPAPTPCEAQVFFFDGVTCSNEFFIADTSSFNSVESCCEMNFGSGSFMNGGCNYVDMCNSMPPTPEPSAFTPVITPEPTPSPLPPALTSLPTESFTPAPTPCEAKVFFFDGLSCSNEFFIADASSYNSVVMCCNDNFGSSSFLDGGCDYTDICSTMPPSPSPFFILTNPPTTGSTPTVSTEVTGPPTMPDRSS